MTDPSLLDQADLDVPYLRFRSSKSHSAMCMLVALFNPVPLGTQPFCQRQSYAARTPHRPLFRILHAQEEYGIYLVSIFVIWSSTRNVISSGQLVGFVPCRINNIDQHVPPLQSCRNCAHVVRRWAHVSRRTRQSPVPCLCALIYVQRRLCQPGNDLTYQSLSVHAQAAPPLV
jgi:hypothetical protein